MTHTKKTLQSLMKTTYKQSLIAAGLTPPQATVYEILLTHGKQKAREITQKTPLKRGLVYKALDDLVAMGLAAKEERRGSVTRFRPEHPSALRNLAQQREKEAHDAHIAVDASLGALTSAFNLTSGKPGVEFFEGKEGVQRALDRILEKGKEIYTYADIDSIDAEVSAINKYHVRKRLRSKIPKKILIRYSQSAIDIAKKERNALTEFRVLPHDGTDHFQTAVEICDDIVLYVTYKNGYLTATLISDPAIAAFHKYLFEINWKKAQRI